VRLVLQGLPAAEKLLERLGARTPGFAIEACDAVGQEIQREVESSLPRETGRLAGSWSRSPTADPPGVILQSSSPYARAHEYGFTGTVMVPGHHRRAAFVAPHLRRMRVRPKRFLRNAMETVRPRMRQIALGVGLAR